MAFSSSSASRWTRSLTTRPATSVAGTELSSMRSYCSTSEAAARSTSTSGTGRVHRRPGSSPARTRRFSPLRRIRVARWSSLNSEESWSGSASRLSSSEMSESWRWMRPWLRRERLVNIALTLPRSSACSAASRTASRCTSSKAVATFPISSRLCTPTDSTEVSTSCGSDSESCLTSSGSRFWETSCAVSWRRRSERTMERATTKAPTRETPRTSRISAPLMIASCWAESRSSRAFCCISLSSVCSILPISSILILSWSYQSRSVRFSAFSPSGSRTARSAYMVAALMSGRLSSGSSRSSELPWRICLKRPSASFSLSTAVLAKRRSLAEKSAPLGSARAALMSARWMEAYSLAEEKVASARVLLIIARLLVACAMSWESSSSELISSL
ncbi:hypothetical protein SANTM175S_02794 [Streptomyces antimycoticus]